MSDHHNRLPDPNPLYGPEGQTELLNRYLTEGVPVRALDFSVVRLEDRDLAEVDLSGCQLRRAGLRGADLSNAALNDSSLEFADALAARFRGADLTYADIRNANFTEADLRDANLYGVNAEGANFSDALLDGADLMDANLWGAAFPGVEMDRVSLRNARVDHETVGRSCWTVDTFSMLVQRDQIRVSELERLADDFRAVVLPPTPGLTVFLSTRLLPWDQTMLHAFTCSVLGTDTDVRVAEYTETGDGSCRVRLTGSNPDDLDRVARHLAKVTWKTEQRSARQGEALLRVDAVLDSLDHIREHLEKKELWVEESGAREMLEDKAAEHIEKKDVALVRTWEQRGLRALWETAKKKAGKEIASEVEDGVKGLLPGRDDE